MKNLWKWTSIRCASTYSPASAEILSLSYKEIIESRIRKAPTLRPPKEEAKSLRKSAVLVPLLRNSENKPAVLFTVRSNQLFKHRGEISFPGGAVEACDQGSCSKAALREANEEIGLDVDHVDVWGELPPTTGRVSYVLRWGTTVVPVLGVLNEAVDLSKLKVDPNEVVEIFTVSLEHLCHPDHQGYTQFRNGYSLPLFFSSDTPRHKIWGLTAIILHQVLKIILPEHYKSNLQFLRSIV